MPALGQATTPLSLYRLSSPFLRNPHSDMTSVVRSGRGFHTNREKLPKLSVHEFCSVNWLRNYGCMLLQLDVTFVRPLTIIVVRRHSENIGSAPSLSLSRASDRESERGRSLLASRPSFQLCTCRSLARPLSLSPFSLIPATATRPLPTHTQISSLRTWTLFIAKGDVGILGLIMNIIAQYIKVV